MEDSLPRTLFSFSLVKLISFLISLRSFFFSVMSLSTWSVWEPLAGGKSLLIEKPPAGLPSDLHNIFPLYLSEESVVLLIGENVFHRAIRPHVHLAILIEIAATETARRLYGIPEGEAFDAALIQQYLERDGRAYQEYLKANQVVDAVDIRLDGSSPRRFKVIPGRVVKN